MKLSAVIVVVCLAASASAAVAQGGKKSSAADAPECVSPAFTDGAMTCSCPANAGRGSVWGSGPYTGDSDICTAARHAGVIGSAGGVVHLIERPGQSGYTGSSANGVTTSGWGSYGESFDFAGGRPGSAPSLAVCAAIPAGIDDFACQCPADPPVRSVWGNGPYTADSDICTAAVHTGYIEAATGGDVYVLRVQGLASYLGSESNGVTTSDWDAYGDSITFDWNR